MIPPWLDNLAPLAFFVVVLAGLSWDVWRRGKPRAEKTRCAFRGYCIEGAFKCPECGR